MTKSSAHPGILNVSRTIRTILVCIPLLGAALLMTACSKEPVQPMRIGTNVWPGYEPLYLARDLGYLGDAFRLVEYASASAAIRDFRNGILEAATLTLDEVLLLAQDGIPLRIALVMDVSHGGDVIIAHAPIDSVAGLRGKKVGVENTAVGAYMLARALELADLESSDLIIVPRRVDEHEQAFRDHEVDAVVTFEPVRSHLLAAGGQSIFDSTRIPNEIVDVLVVAQHYWDAHPARIQELLIQWFHALDYLHEHPEDAAARMAPRLRMEPAQVTEALRGLRLPGRTENLRMLVKNGAVPVLLDSAYTLTAIMLREGLLRHNPALDPLFPTAAHWLNPQETN